MAEYEMVVVNGVRYRPEDAPRQTEPAPTRKAPAKTKARQPQQPGDPAAAEVDTK